MVIFTELKAFKPLEHNKTPADFQLAMNFPATSTPTSSSFAPNLQLSGFKEHDENARWGHPHHQQLPPTSSASPDHHHNPPLTPVSLTSGSGGGHAPLPHAQSAASGGPAAATTPTSSSSDVWAMQYARPHPHDGVPPPPPPGLPLVESPVQELVGPGLHGGPHGGPLGGHAPHDQNSPPAVSPPLCAGCSLRIVDKFYLCAVEQKWHSTCLKCAECGVELESQMSCFEKNGAIFCKDDYVRLYGSRQCSRCLQEIQANDLVMKARNCLFHVDCFRCDTCQVVLKKGDLFGMFENILYCRDHFDLLTSSTNTGPPGSGGPRSVGGAGGGGVPLPASSDPASLVGADPSSVVFPPGAFPPPQHGGGPYPFLGGPPPGGPHPGEAWFPPGGPEFGLIPGGGDFPYENNNEPSSKKRRGRKKRKVDAYASMNGYLDGSYQGALDGSGQHGGGKAKRARTSFKHHQLRIMKAHFQINQNPDSRELKMLSQKTGLDKKVLQVWFQNSRAKWRRINAQSGSSGGAQGSHMGSGVDEALEEACDSDSMAG